MDERNLKFWFALKSVEGVGNIGFRNLLSAFGSPQSVFAAPLEALKRVPGIKEQMATSISRFNKWDEAERELELCQKNGVSIITSLDPSYPRLLSNIHDYPPLLYVKGNLPEDEATIAVVGSRAATAYGKFTTERMSRELSLNGFTVVSGMARGIDSAAHRGALSAGGETIAVLGCGIDVVYPPENKHLYEEIAPKGAVVTEFPFGTQPNAPNFPMRNRIISGLSLGVVVVEATDKSGSLITARMALEQGREVFAVPGIIDSPGSKGTHRLIKEGAKLVETIQDILEEIMPQLKKPLTPLQLGAVKADPLQAQPPLKESESAVLGILSERAVDVDTIIEKTGFGANDVLSILLSLELKGRVEQKPGKNFIRKEC
jgi:DNA processing protein